MAMLNLFTSTVTYPLDTLKRKMQVNGSYGYTKEFNSTTHGLHYMKNHLKSEMFRYVYYYLILRGFSMHFARTIPFSVIQYQLYYLFMKTTVESRGTHPKAP